MSIAISCACGPLHKWGYQHTSWECLSSQAEFADRLYLVQSTADSTGVARLFYKYRNIVLISNPGTWHHRPEDDTDEELTIYNNPVDSMSGFTKFHMRNLATGRLAAFRDGLNVVMSTHSNWYIPRVNNLRSYCEEFEKSGERTGPLWTLGQLHDRLLGPPVRRDALCNLTRLNEDEILDYYPDMKARHCRETGKFFQCLVDCSYSLLPEEFGSMQIRFHYPGYEHWNWEEYRKDLIKRLSHRCTLIDAPLDYWGEQIVTHSNPDFMGYQLLQGLLNDNSRHD